MTNALNRRETIIGAYLCVVEPLVFPAITATIIAGLAVSAAAAATVMVTALPVTCLVLFRTNGALLSTHRRLLRRTSVFSVTVVLEGLIALFALAILPFLALAFFSTSRLDAADPANTIVKVQTAATIAAGAATVGVVFRLFALAMEELRFMSEKYR